MYLTNIIEWCLTCMTNKNINKHYSEEKDVGEPALFLQWRHMNIIIEG